MCAKRQQSSRRTFRKWEPIRSSDSAAAASESATFYEAASSSRTRRGEEGGDSERRLREVLLGCCDLEGDHPLMDRLRARDRFRQQQSEIPKRGPTQLVLVVRARLIWTNVGGVVEVGRVLK